MEVPREPPTVRGVRATAEVADAQKILDGAGDAAIDAVVVQGRTVDDVVPSAEVDGLQRRRGAQRYPCDVVTGIR